ncbi:threonyl-tRNA synthetase [Desulfurococcaceae archaeon AG1]|nr:MAG: threonine--tRNA ligase [Desulfurococcaceae archaeon]GAY26448.1 threonyl-tRNA synthetase [Desulfurococcaceae archaeon AG1]
MRILAIHAERFSYRVREPAIEKPEDITSRDGVWSNVLVAFTTVERNDNQDQDIAVKASGEIMDILSKVKADGVIIYPYAHLSQDLAPPEIAITVLREIERVLRENGVKVWRAPFGWYKEFELKCYGHPLSELSRRITPGVRVKKTFEKIYYIMDLDGKLYSPEDYKEYDKYPDLRALVEKEIFKKEGEGVRSRVSDYLRKFGFEWEGYSDPGHMRYSPHATAILESVTNYSWTVVKSLGIPVFRVKGTNMFDLSVKAVKEHADLFGDRLYEVDSEESRLVMRYAACHQQFAMLKDWILSYKDLPLGMFEVADSYRYEQRGELLLGFRLRRFHMPDMHILCKDLEEAMELTLRIRDKIFEEAGKIGRDYVAIINVTKGFLESSRDYLLELIRRDGKPALIVVYPDNIYYWVINIEYNIVDVTGRPREIATFQIDIGNAERFGISYADQKGVQKKPVIIHTAIIGSVERYIYMLFDTAAKMEEEGRTPYLPFWVSPIQVRIVPVKQEHIGFAEEIFKAVSERGFRVDIDDRDESLARKLRDAGIEWAYFVVIIGDREVKTKTLSVRERATGDQRVYSLEEFIELLEKLSKGYPKVELTMPHLVSKRPSLPYLREL